MINHLTDSEQEELVALKRAINDNVSSVHYNKMERFTELLVRTLSGKGAGEMFMDPTNF
jgi:hypothetical protein